MRSRVLLALVLFAAVPSAASAQFTTYIAPPKKGDTVQTPTVAQAKAAADSATRASLGNMKAWVDSAAGETAPAGTTTVAMADSDVMTTTPSTARETTTFRNGAAAPQTASDLPMLALIGFAALSLGTVMLAGRGRA